MFQQVHVFSNALSQTMNHRLRDGWAVAHIVPFKSEQGELLVVFERVTESHLDSSAAEALRREHDTLIG